MTDIASINKFAIISYIIILQPIKHITNKTSKIIVIFIFIIFLTHIYNIC